MTAGAQHEQDPLHEAVGLWVDEVEKTFVGIGACGDGSEVATRLFGYFLTWMQNKTKQVFVIATANDISALPPELLRTGRFDEIFCINFPNRKECAETFRVHLQKRGKLSAQIQLDRPAQATAGCSGADIESVVKEAIEQVFVDGRAALDTDRLLKMVKQHIPTMRSHEEKGEGVRGSLRRDEDQAGFPNVFRQAQMLKTWQGVDIPTLQKSITRPGYLYESGILEYH